MSMQISLTWFKIPKYKEKKEERRDHSPRRRCTNNDELPKVQYSDPATPSTLNKLNALSKLNNTNTCFMSMPTQLIPRATCYLPPAPSKLIIRGLC